jgi:hypothetical protein
MGKITDFFTNKAADDAPIKGPALSITKVGVGGGFALAVLSGVAGLIGPLKGADPAVATAVLALAEKAILAAALIAVADIAARAAVAVLKPSAPQGTTQQTAPPGGGLRHPPV